MNPSYASLDDDLRPETFLPPKPTRTRTRMLSDDGDRHIGHYWGSEIPLHQRSASSGATKPPSRYEDPMISPQSPSARTRRDSLQRYHDRDIREYNYEDEEWDERDRMRRGRRRTPLSSERSPSPMDYKIRERLMRLEELEMGEREESEEMIERERLKISTEREMRERERLLSKEREIRELEILKILKEREMLKALEEREVRERERLKVPREREKREMLKILEEREREKQAMKPAELDEGKESERQEGKTSLEKRDELDGDKQPEKQEETATPGRHVELEGDNEPGDQGETRIKLENRERERISEMRKRLEEEIKQEKAKKEEEEIKQRMLLVKAKEEAERLFEENVKAKFRDAGYSEKDAERILRAQREKRAKEEEKSSDGLGLNKKTYIKVNRKYIVPETLDVYRLPWEVDEKDENFIIIKRWIPKESQDVLFEHTRKIKQQKLLALDADIKGDDKLYIIRKKSPDVRRRSQMFL